ncbi:unnamed protein product [Vitrella brassicaformis CCMP3155]|uniref:Protein kinase domain-containing protein n=1 Tax=Vitrella brassicaformis (strain CCMP3155) TaxID=1169540 RepID=A0A0G4GV29_VITBC|nr:unnamed protein product [Vitrella brassicaformis CCMP3155]|eukprot:CEM34483.1 unnamed protein product [Vitrella brassicaformis CCMP3155]
MEKVLVYAPVTKDAGRFPPLPALQQFLEEDEASYRQLAQQLYPSDKAERVVALRKEKKEAEKKWERLTAERAVEEYLYYRMGLTLEAKTGFGGQGKVWRAGDYAIKVLAPDFSTGGEYARHTYRIYCEQGLRHCPYLPRYYFSFSAGGRTVYVMEFLRGTTVWELARQTEADAKCIIRDTLKALGFLHHRGLSHGDMKPDNVMVLKDRAVLIDLDHLRHDYCSGSGAADDLRKTGEVLLKALGADPQTIERIATLTTPQSVAATLASFMPYQPSGELIHFILELFHGDSTAQELLGLPWLISAPPAPGNISQPPPPPKETAPPTYAYLRPQSQTAMPAPPPPMYMSLLPLPRQPIPPPQSLRMPPHHPPPPPMPIHHPPPPMPMLPMAFPYMPPPPGMPLHVLPPPILAR